MSDVMEELCDGRYRGFQGVEGNAFALDGTLYEAIEDPDDGYRSYLSTVRCVGPLVGPFFGRPVAELRVRRADPGERDLDGWALVDAAGHVWLEFGTDNFDDYYPTFVFRYDPPRGDA